MALKLEDGVYVAKRQNKKKTIVTVETPDIEARLNDPNADYHRLANEHFLLVEELPDDQVISDPLPCGTYTHVKLHFGTTEYLLPSQARKDEMYLDLGSIAKLSDDINLFLKSKPVYEKIRTPYRRGYMLYGPPGNGKTALIRELTKKYKDEAVIIWCRSIPSDAMLAELNKITQMKIVIYEEIVHGFDSEIGLGEFLDFMDGERSLNNCITIATTNYPEKLTANLANRPSRFDVVYEVGNPSIADAKKLLSKYLDAELTDDFGVDLSIMSVAQLKEIALLTLMHNISVRTAFNKLKDHMERFNNMFQKRKKLGLGHED